jgi:hypothetical protein
MATVTAALGAERVNVVPNVDAVRVILTIRPPSADGAREIQLTFVRGIRPTAKPFLSTLASTPPRLAWGT